MDLIAYVRISSLNKADHEPSSAEQIAQIRAWAGSAEHTLAGIETDAGVSGAHDLEDREGLSAALTMLLDGQAQGLVVAHMDRLSREMTVQEAILSQVWAAGGRVFSADAQGEILQDDPDDPMRRAMRQMAGVFAELERGMIRARLARGKRAKRAAGGYAGGYVPLGKVVAGKDFAVDEVEQATVDHIVRLRSEGSSLRQIIVALNAGGYRTKRGGEWYPSTISRVVSRANGMVKAA